MSIPLVQTYRIARYILEQKLKGNKRYPLVLMLEPLFQCNLACAGCGKIEYPDEILRKRMSVEDALKAVDECGAPVVSIPGGEPLIHKEMPQIVEGIVARKKFVYLCTNALLLEQKLDQYTPSPYLTFSIHLDGNRERHDTAVDREGTFDKAVAAIKAARARGFRVTANCTLFAGEDPEDVANFFDYAMTLGVEGVMMSPGYSYQHAPRQDVFLGRRKSKELFREIFKIGKKRKQQVALQPVEPVPRLPRRQPELSVHAVGEPDLQRVRLAEALLPARRRGLRAELQGAHGDHGLGQVRRRPQPEVRQLHGALRLRGHGGRAHDREPADRAQRVPVRPAARRRDGAGAAGAARRPSARRRGPDRPDRQAEPQGLIAA